MLTILFWNLHRSTTIAPTVTRLAWEVGADVVVLAECETFGPILQGLNDKRVEYRPITVGARVRIVTRRSPLAWKVVDDRPTYAILENSAIHPPLILAVAHLPSALHAGIDSRNMICRELAESVRKAERHAGHQNTIVAGDLNLNPFDGGVAHADGLHGTMDRAIAAKGSRTIQGTKYPFFYNPMWRFLGERSGEAGTRTRPYGTYYHWRATNDCLFWYTYDQVLIRPALLPYFRDEWLIVPTETSLQSFLDAGGRPDRGSISDHLPVKISLDL